MADVFRPESDRQVAEAVAWAAAEEVPLELQGRGSKRALGRPVQASHSLDLSALSGIDLYEPEELVLSAKAGTPLAEIDALLSEQKQALAFEPADLGPLLGGEPGAATIGGVLACNLSGPRRIKAGAARDHFLGVEAVSGRGEIFKSGGRVVKNVTGYDLCKVLAGSYGTLAAMTQVTVKVLPTPEKTRTVLVLGLDETGGLEAMTRALASSHEVSGAAHLPAALILESEVSYVREAGASVTALRIEGPAASVAYRCTALREALSDLGPTEELHGHNSALFWGEIRDVRPFWSRPDYFVWRLSVPPQEGPSALARIEPRGDHVYFYDWGGGLIWLAIERSPDALEQAVREALAPCGGHATLIRATDSIRASIPVFQPQEPGLAALTKRVKGSFDPCGVLNPGRMVAGG